MRHGRYSTAICAQKGLDSTAGILDNRDVPIGTQLCRFYTPGNESRSRPRRLRLLFGRHTGIVNVLYIDESGDTGALAHDDQKSQPLLVVGALCVPQLEVEPLTRTWVEIKRRFHPGLCVASAPTWDWMVAEVKGTDLRRSARSDDRATRRSAIGFFDRVLDLLDRHGISISARVWVKKPDAEFNGRSVYTFSIQWLCEQFQMLLEARQTQGVVIADSRTAGPNINVAHSIFTRKHQAKGGPYSRIVEVPLFGHSNNHAGLQLADVVFSGLLAPICCDVFVRGRLTNQHARPEYAALSERYLTRLESLLMSNQTTNSGKHSIQVSNKLGDQGARMLFKHSRQPGVRPRVAQRPSSQ